MIPVFHRTRCRRCVLLLLVLLPFLIRTSGQCQEVKSGGSARPSAAQIVTQDQIDDFGKKINEAKSELESVQAGMESAAGDVPGITLADKQKKVSLMIRRLSTMEQLYDTSKGYLELQQSAAELQNTINSWSGFPGKPPYNLEISDGIRRTIYLLDQEIENKEFRQSMQRTQLQNAKSTREKAQQELRKINDQLESAKDSAEQAKLRWQRQLGQLEIQVAEEAIVASELMIRINDEALAVNRQNVAFQKNKLYSVLPQTVFTGDELEAKLKELEQVSLSDEKKLLEVEKRDHKVEQVIQGIRDSFSKDKTAGKRARNDVLEKDLEMALFLQKNLRGQIEELRILTLGNSATGYYFKERFRLMAATDLNDLLEARTQIQKGLVRLDGYLLYFENSLRPLREQIQEVEYNMATATPRGKKALEEILDVQQQRVKLLDRGVMEGQVLQRMAQSILDDIASKTTKKPVEDRMLQVFKQVPKVLGDIWHYEVFAVEDAIIIDGQTFREKRAVSIGKILIALVMLFVGIWSGRHVIRFSDRIAVEKFKIRPQWALLWSRILYTLLVVLILISALALVKIPLTAFAFAGGALAIGVGFGAQNLINNFISSFILMAEQPIKVGDMVEVEGARGRVTQIGARCVQIRRFDGIEILIPNSTFLEKSVVNLTLSDDVNRYMIVVGVAYGSPTRHVDNLLKQVAMSHPEVLKIPAPGVVFEDFGDSTLQFKLLFWIQGTSDLNLISSELRHRIAETFQKENIVMAFPQRDIHLDVTKPVQVFLGKEA